MQLISLKCTNCGADLQVEPGRQEIFCTYCGTKLLLDNGSINITSRIVDEARLKEAEVRLKELEYAHERELREETLRQEQKKSQRMAVMVYLAALAVSYLFPNFRTYFPLVLFFGGIALISMRSGDRKNIRSGRRYDDSRKSRVVALILCIFFGTLGVHYFYAGRVGMGLLYLFTLGFFGIGWLIDIIRIACGTFTDRDGLYLKS